MTVLRPPALLAALFLLVGVHVAQDAPATPAVTPIKPLELYKLKGRAWSHRITEWTRAAKPRIKNEVGKVTASGDETADFEADYTLEGGGESGGRSSRIYFKHELDGENKTWADANLPEETLDMGFARFACRKHVAKEEGVQTTTWVSAEYHPLIVKQVKLGKDTCEIRKLTSFHSGQIDPAGLFKVVGRRMKIHVSKLGSAQMTVLSVGSDSATYEEVKYDADGNADGDPKTKTIRFDDENLLRREDTTSRNGEVTKHPWRELAPETIAVKAGEFPCKVFETSTGKAWISGQWPCLPVKGEGENSEMELVEFDLGHDAVKLYRKVGNYSVTKMTTQVAGMNMETTMRSEVVSIANGEAKVKMTTTTQGNAFSNELEMPVPEAKPPFLPYDGQVEESITTPAGTFRCIRTEVEGSGMTMWMHHGVVVKSAMKNDNMEMIQELIELRME